MSNGSARAIEKQSKTSHQKRRLLKVASIIVAIVMLFVVHNVVTEWSTALSMSDYLRKKYNQEFIVEKPRLSVAGLGIEGTWGADARPVNNKNLTFRIIKAENRDSFSDQYTAKIWSQRETARLNKIAQQNASSSKWKVNASVEIYLAEPLADTARPDNPKMENIIKQDHGLSYTVELSYKGLESDTSVDDMVNDANRITSVIRDSNIHNLDINYSISTKHGKTKKCETTYDKPFNYSYANIKNCLK